MINTFLDVVNTITTQVQQDIQNIELVKAAIYASCIGTIIFFVRSIPLRIRALIYRYAFSSIEVNNNDSAYVWLQEWLTERISQKAHHVVVSTNNFQEHEHTPHPVHDPYGNIKEKNDVDSLVYKPLSGPYLMFYKGFPIRVSFTRERIEERNMFAENIYMSCFFRKGLLRDILKQAQKDSQLEGKKTISLFTANYHHWAAIGEKSFRPKESLVYDKDILDNLLNDANDFIKRKDWYQDMGIPWRRGYLLYGPPGNGKTSLAYALASELKFDIYILSLASGAINAENLMNLMNLVPNKAIILIEEIDEIFKKDKADDVRLVGGLSHTSVLNALDGIASREGRIVMMTTNYKERISPALIRPGRADMHLYIGNASYAQGKAMFSRFFPQAEETQATAFANKLETLSGQVSMAALQNHLVRFQNDAIKAIQYISQESLFMKQEALTSYTKDVSLN